MFKRRTATSSGTTQMPQKRSGQPGQVAVVVLLIMAALLIIVLNYASRTTDQVFLSGQQQDSTRVFNAAESGVEEALSRFDGATQPANTNLSSPTGIEIDNAQVSAQDGQLKLDNLPEGMAATVYLAGNDPQVIVDWATEAGDCDARASLILSLYYIEGGVTKTLYRPISPACFSIDNGFLDVPEAPSGTYEHTYTWGSLPASSGQKMLRITAVYAGTQLLVSSADGIVQAHDVTVRARDTADAIGSTGGTSSEERAIQVTRTVPAPPMVLDYAVYSGGTLNKSN